MPRTEVLDLTGLTCPHVAVAAKRALRSMASGDVLEVLCTDPMAALDLPTMAHQLGCDSSVGDEIAGCFVVVLTVGRSLTNFAQVWPSVD